MSKKKKARKGIKNLLEFEIKNSQEVELPKFGKTDEVVTENKAEESIIQEAEVEEKEVILDDEANMTDDLAKDMDEKKDVTVEKPLTEKQRNRKIDTYIEFILIFILGVLIGIAFKTEAEKRITIGFDDYQMKIVQQDYDINKIQFEVTKKSIEESKAQNGEDAVTDETTSQIEE
jgi:hypothetical protein